MEPSNKKQRSAGGGAANSKRPATPLSLYKQALRLIKQQPCGDISSDALIAEKLQQVVLTLTADSTAQQSGTVEHSLDLELSADEPGFLLASAHLQLGLLLQRQDALEGAAQQLQHSLCCFPRFAAAHSTLGHVLKSSAASASELQQAEHYLRQALDIAADLEGQEGGLLVESNKACAAELEAADAARGALVMLLCQAGRDEEAMPLLQQLGFRFRLAREVLHYAVPDARQPPAAAEQVGEPGSSRGDISSSGDAGSRQYLQVVDNALPAALLQHLQAAFAPLAPFWSEHNYGRVGYFSYYFSLDEPASSSMHQLARHLQTLAARYFPAVAEARYAEFWAHCRRHASGHQLHFDSDDEGQGGVRNPIISSVLYLSANTSSSPSSPGSLSTSTADATQQHLQAGSTTHVCSAANGGGGSSQQRNLSFIGGPTLVTDQRLGGPLATRGWLSYPAVNRLTMFDGSYLHGVVPGRGASPAADGRRCTLMVAFWRELRCRTPPGSAAPGACMVMPNPSSSQCQQQWPRMLLPREGGWGSCKEVPVRAPLPVSAVWQATSGSGPSAAGAEYDACFQGF